VLSVGIAADAGGVCAGSSLITPNWARAVPDDYAGGGLGVAGLVASKLAHIAPGLLALARIATSASLQRFDSACLCPLPARGRINPSMGLPPSHSTATREQRLDRTAAESCHIRRYRCLWRRDERAERIDNQNTVIVLSGVQILGIEDIAA